MRLSTGCPPLDELLGGGVETGAITLVYGEAGTGKTNLCLQLARNAILQTDSKVAYVDTEGVSMERLSQIAGEHAPRVLQGVLFFHPHSLEDQARMVQSLDKIPTPSLIAVDSMNMYYRLGLARLDDDHVGRTLTNMLGELLRLTRVHDVPIIVTGQVYTSAEEGSKAFGGRIMEHIVKTIIRFDRLAPGIRRATVLKHRSVAEGRSAEFYLTRAGLSGSPG